MEMSHNPVQLMHDHEMITHWAKAMDLDPGHVFASSDRSLLWYAKNNNLKFQPEWSPVGQLLHTRALEHLRKALVHECVSNLLDIGLNLDDDMSDSLDFLKRLNAVTALDDRHRPTWLTVPTDSLILRTVSDDIFRAWEG